MTVVFTDSSLMPFGKHAGTALSAVPASYLLWLADEVGKRPQDSVRTALRAYVDVNRAALEQEAEAEKLERGFTSDVE